MLQQIGQALTFDVMYIESKVGKTLLTVTVDVYRNGSLIVTGGAATEVGDGLYTYTLAAGSVTVAGHYRAVFKTATTTVDQRDIAALWIVGTTWVERVDGAISAVLTAIAALPALVWTYSSRSLTQTLASIIASISGTAISQVRADRWTVNATITAFTWDAGAVLRFTAKPLEGYQNLADSSATIQIRKSFAGVGDGLIYLIAAGIAYVDPTEGNIIINNAATGSVTLAMLEDATSQLPPGTYRYDWKLYRTIAGTVTLASGILTIQPTVTRTIT